MMKKGGVFLISFISVFLVSIFASLFTNTTTEWYLSQQPSFTPPGIVFSIVWPLLYLSIIIALFLTLTHVKKKKTFIILFTTNLLANAFWSFFFFELQLPLLSFIDLLLIITTTGMIIFMTKQKAVRYLLMPYFLWTFFAAVLNVTFLI